MHDGIDQAPFNHSDFDLIDYYQRCYGVYDNQRHISAVVKTSYDKYYNNDFGVEKKDIVKYMTYGFDFE